MLPWYEYFIVFGIGGLICMIGQILIITTKITTARILVLFEMIGAFSREDATNDQVTLVVEMEDGTYKRHIIGLNEDTMYVIEDLGGAEVNKYKYEVNYIPESIVPFEITDKK